MGFSEPRPERTKTCIVQAANDPTVDDAPAIQKAFSDCKENARIVFEDTTYNIFTVMNTTGLRNVDVEVQGTLKWNNDNIDYWLANSLYIGFQNQTSAWFFGGHQVHFYGNGQGTIDGSGQVWYNYNNGRSNLHGRPHAITISDTKDSVIEGLRFIKSQMWTSTVIRSEQVLLQDIYVNNSCEPGAGTFGGCNLNTDGSDTVYANNITYLRWTYEGGDDAITLKQNSTNIYVADCDFYSGSGIALGSIGQYPGQIEVMENFTATNIRTSRSRFGCRLKTFTGNNKGYPPNGGGGGIGHARNLTCEDFTLDDVEVAWSTNQKTAFDGQPGGSNTSLFKIEDLNFGNSRGTIRGQLLASFQCSAAAPCEGINLYDNDFAVTSDGSTPKTIRCTNVESPEGFECTDGCGPDDNLCPS